MLTIYANLERLFLFPHFGIECERATTFIGILLPSVWTLVKYPFNSSLGDTMCEGNSNTESKERQAFTTGSKSTIKPDGILDRVGL